MDYTISCEHQIFKVKFRGRCAMDDILKVNDELGENAKEFSNVKVLFDLSEAEMTLPHNIFAIELGRMVRDMRTYIKRHESIKTAILVGNRRERIFSEAFAIMCKPISNYTIKVCDQYKQAIEWLES